MADHPPLPASAVAEGLRRELDERNAGHSKLVYNKTTRTIITVSADPRDALIRELVAALAAYESEREDLEDRAPVDPDCVECNLGVAPHKRTCAHHLARAVLIKIREG